jgi:hypothetical protein
MAVRKISIIFYSKNYRNFQYQPNSSLEIAKKIPLKENQTIKYYFANLINGILSRMAVFGYI